MRKKLYKGPIGKALVRGTSITDALNTVADHWIAGVTQAKGAYENGLAKYLGYYLPAIENFYANKVASTPGYFDPANMETRIQTAAAVMRETSRIAREYKERRLQDAVRDKVNSANVLGQGLMVGGVRLYGLSTTSSKESAEKVKIKASVAI